jgi:hypothetical protein
MGRLARLLGTETAPRRTLDGFVDSLLQTFENSRPGLTADMLAKGLTEGFFLDLYEKEVKRLREKVERLGHLSPREREELLERVDERIRKVVLPAYCRLASKFTPRERNDFFGTPESLHGPERVAWGTLGLLLGAFVVWAPFIPLWSKEWVLVFGVGGLVFPSLRAYLAQRRYQSELNDLVARTDDEIWRLDLGYMTSAAERDPLVAGEAALALPGSEPVTDSEAEKLAARLEDAARTSPERREARPTEKER